jgi:hypothetical protein
MIFTLIYFKRIIKIFHLSQVGELAQLRTQGRRRSNRRPEPSSAAQEKLMALKDAMAEVLRTTVHSKLTCVSNGGSRSPARANYWSVLHRGGSQFGLTSFTW